MIGKSVVLLAILSLACATWHCENRQCRRCGRGTNFPCRFPNYRDLNTCLENCECDLGSDQAQLPLYQCFRRAGRCQRCQPERTRCPGPAASILGEAGSRGRTLPVCSTRNRFFPTANDCRRNCRRVIRDRPRRCFVRICNRFRRGRFTCRVVNRCQFRVGGARGITMEILDEEDMQALNETMSAVTTGEGETDGTSLFGELNGQSSSVVEYTIEEIDGDSIGTAEDEDEMMPKEEIMPRMNVTSPALDGEKAGFIEQSGLDISQSINGKGQAGIGDFGELDRSQSASSSAGGFEENAGVADIPGLVGVPKPDGF